MAGETPKQGKPKDLAYYITLFKIEGHSTWRGHLASNKKSFEDQLQPTTPKVTAKRIIRIDRITGELKEEK